jgi:hypothetical protein
MSEYSHTMQDHGTKRAMLVHKVSDHQMSPVVTREGAAIYCRRFSETVPRF